MIGNKSHKNSTFLSSEILSSSYKIIRKDRSLGGGGVSTGFRNTINISELSDPSSEAEMLWAKQQILNNRPLYLCSFYRPLNNNNVIPIATLNKSMSDIFRDEKLQSPQILVAGDFNLPSISWIDGTGQVNLMVMVLTGYC